MTCRGLELHGVMLRRGHALRGVNTLCGGIGTLGGGVGNPWRPAPVRLLFPLPFPCFSVCFLVRASKMQKYDFHIPRVRLPQNSARG